MRQTKILYIQHAGALGGSAMSLLYTIQALDRTKFEPVVALIRESAAVRDLYADVGIETIFWPGIRTFEHTTAAWYPLYSPRGVMKLALQTAKWRSSAKSTTKLIANVKPDIVHLNSVVLAPCAASVRKSRVPLVWHVREAVSHGHAGFRRRYLGRLLETIPDQSIFISEFDRNSWVGGRTGVVINNFVDFSKFDRRCPRVIARKALDLPESAPLVLFLGGTARVKGFYILLEAIPRVLSVLPEARFIIPGADFSPSGGWASRAARAVLPMFGTGTPGQRLERRIESRNIGHALLIRPFTQEVATYFAACDVLVFPSTEAHFARPIVEAGAMARPVVGSRIGGVTELVEDQVTGVLVPPKDPTLLAEALIRVLSDRVLGGKMGEAGYNQAILRFNANINIAAIEEIYARYHRM